MKIDYENTLTYINISPENDLRIKTGLGSVTGKKVKAMAKARPDSQVLLITQSENSPYDTSENNLRTIALPSNLNPIEFSMAATQCAFEFLDTLPANARVAIEGSDWQGPAAHVFEKVKESKNKNIFTYTFVHNGMGGQYFANKGTLETSDPQLEKIIKQEETGMANSDAIMHPSDFIKQYTLTEVYPRLGEIDIATVRIANPANTERFHPNGMARSKAIDTIREIKGPIIDAKNYNVFIPGRVEPIKAGDDIVKTAEILLKEVPNAHFYFIGDYYSEKDNSGNPFTIEYLYSLVPEKVRKNIHFLGRLDNKVMAEVMNAGDVFFMPWPRDNWPTTHIEAGLAQRPIVTTNLGGIPQMLETPDGPAAYVIMSTGEEGHIEAAKHLADHFNDPTKGNKLAQAFRQKIINNFSAEAVCMMNWATLDFLSLRKSNNLPFNISC